MAAPRYSITVYTGDRLHAGTDAKVRIILHDEFGNASPTKTLDNRRRNDFERGRGDSFEMSETEIGHLNPGGKLVKIELWRNRSWFGGYWFVDRIEIENKVSREKFVFPIFRWIKAKFHYHVNHLDTSLPQKEEHKDQREMELAAKRKTYQFDQKVPGGPVQVKTLPLDEQFSFAHKWDLQKLKLRLVSRVLWKRLRASREWTSLSDLDTIYDEVTKDSGNDMFNKPKGADKWKNDVHFGLQRVAGLNNCTIEVVKEIPHKFPVRDELLGTLLGGLTIAEAISRKRLFICDLEILDGLPVKKDFVLCSPIGLFFVNAENQLMPVAIQLFQEPGPENPIFTPDIHPLTWALVKMWYNNADAAHHQALTHLGMTHLLMEGITIATHRNLSQSHPIFKLLAPHFLYILAINSRGLKVLISDGGWVDKTMNFGKKGLFALIVKSYERWRMDIDGTLPKDLERRGFPKLDDGGIILPGYHFRDDALLVHDAICKYVKSYVELYYPSPNDLEGDNEIQSWAEELVKPRQSSNGGVGILGVPGNGKITTHEQLEQILTCIIFTCSISHGSANFPQYEEYGVPANYPGLLRGKPPNNTKTVTTEREILNCLPDRPTTLNIMIVTKLLSNKGTKSLGDFEVQYIFDPDAFKILEEFKTDLQGISQEIKRRNSARNQPYTYMDPEVIPNSISI
ncbi:unnamed protein product [Lymnaea stagnalis]|uniref:Uncharacterized protein n=1 Tax=Lymnaea stagnalis TaxID=6523 RepID=A0AAV2HSD6_LYMST